MACAVALSVWHAPAVEAQTPPQGEAETLRQALEAAYSYNPALKAMRNRLRASRETLVQALAPTRPDAQIAGNYGWRRTTANGSRTTRPHTAALTVTQSLYDGGRTAAAANAARSAVAADCAHLFATEQNVLRRAVAAHADVAHDQTVLELNANNQTVHERQLEAARSRLRVGVAAPGDVARATARLARAAADRIEAEGQLTEAQTRYRNVVGKPPGAIRAARPPAGASTTLEQVLREARRNNFDVVRARHSETAARWRVREIYGEQLPRLTLTGRLERRGAGGSDTTGKAVTLGVALPLGLSGAVASRRRQAMHVVSQLQDEIAEAVREAEQAATEAWQRLQTARARMRAFEEAIRSAEVALRGVRKEAEIGLRAVVDVLDTEQELLEARVDLVDAQRDALVAGYDLRRATGALTAEKLGLSVSPPDPGGGADTAGDRCLP